MLESSWSEFGLSMLEEMYGIGMKVRVVGILCVSKAIFISISDDLILRDNLRVN